MADKISSTRKRKGNFSAWEMRQLISHVKTNSHVLFSSFCSTITNSEKKRLWSEITEKLNSSSTVQRTVEEVRKKWQDLRSQVKKRLAEQKRLSSKTGGGPPPPPLNELEEEVASTIPECQVTGIEGAMESTFDSGIVTCVTEPVGLLVNSEVMPTGTEADTPSPATTLPEDYATGADNDAFEVADTPRPLKQGKRSSSQLKKSNTDFGEVFVYLKKKKMEEERAFRAEMLQLERRKTEALERIAQSLTAREAKDLPDSQSFSLSPLIKFM